MPKRKRASENEAQRDGPAVATLSANDSVLAGGGGGESSSEFVECTGLWDGEDNFVRDVNSVLETHRAGNRCCFTIAAVNPSPTPKHCHWKPPKIDCNNHQHAKVSWIAANCPDIVRQLWRQFAAAVLNIISNTGTSITSDQMSAMPITEANKTIVDCGYVAGGLLVTNKTIVDCGYVAGGLLVNLLA